MVMSSAVMLNSNPSRLALENDLLSKYRCIGVPSYFSGRPFLIRSAVPTLIHFIGTASRLFVIVGKLIAVQAKGQVMEGT
jgi:hypothetical protein